MQRPSTLAGRLSRVWILIGGVIMVLGVGWLDHETGLYLSLALIYLGPITLVTWKLGRAPGIFVAGVSAIVGLTSDLTGAPTSLGVVPILNACTRLVVFWLIVIALDGLRRTHEAERRMARTDPLTGVSNARHFAEETRRHIAGSRRYGYDVTVAYLDLDNFKAINDTFGHSTGDTLLRQVGEVLTGIIRPTDLVARIGGDEFVVLLPHTDESGAVLAVSRYRSAVLDAMDTHGWAVTVSVGIVELNGDISTVDEFVGAADSSMYAAKRAGKDRIIASLSVPGDPSGPANDPAQRHRPVEGELVSANSDRPHRNEDVETATRFDQRLHEESDR